MSINTEDLSKRMSRRLANYEISDKAIDQLANRIVVEGLSIGNFNPCIYGICVDYFTDTMPDLRRWDDDRAVAKFEVFPYGVIARDRFHVRVGYNVDELEGKVPVRAFNR